MALIPTYNCYAELNLKNCGQSSIILLIVNKFNYIHVILVNVLTNRTWININTTTIHRDIFCMNLRRCDTSDIYVRIIRPQMHTVSSERLNLFINKKTHVRSTGKNSIWHAQWRHRSTKLPDYITYLRKSRVTTPLKTRSLIIIIIVIL